MAETFPISGNIDPKSFPFLLMDLHRQGATGSLKVEGPAYPKALYFRAGRILFGSSNDPKDQLGSILIENGKITPEQLADVNTKVGPGNPLAKVLAESGFVNQRELGEAARVKVERILSDILAYTTGSFEFEDGVLPKGAVDLKLSTEKLVLAAVRRIPDRAFVLRHIQGLDVVLAPKADGATQIADVRTEASDLTTHLDGRRSLKSAAQLGRVDEFEATKIACALLFLGLVEPAPVAAEVAPDAELDLAATAAMAFGGGEPGVAGAPPPELSEDPFFTGDAEPPPIAVAESAPFPMPESEPFAAIPEPATPEPSFLTADANGEPDLSLTVPGVAAFSTAPAAAEEATGFSISPEVETTALPVMEPPAAAPVIPAPASFVPTETPSFRMPPFSPEPLEAEPADTGHEPVAPSRPSKEDLAALDALLNPAAAPRPLEPAKAPSRSGRWEPQFQSMARPRRPARSQAPPVLLISLAVGAIVLVAGGSWYYLNYVQARPAATPPPVTQARASVPPSPIAPLATPPAPASEAAPTSVPSAAPTGAATPTAPPLAASVPPTPPAATPMPAPPVTPLDRGPVTEARSLMRKGSFGPAAKGFAANVKAASGSPFTIQLLVACSTETVQKALDRVADDDLYILPVSYKGKSCHRICWGLYDSETGADSAVRGLPDYFRQNGATPKVVRTATLLR
jgi:septal ring-binding cell division protein DamX